MQAKATDRPSMAHQCMNSYCLANHLDLQSNPCLLPSVASVWEAFVEERVLPRSLRRLFDRSWGAVMLNAVWLPSLDRGFGKLWTVDFRSGRA